MAGSMHGRGTCVADEVCMVGGEQGKGDMCGGGAEGCA